jgi:hypothetical protein
VLGMAKAFSISSRVICSHPAVAGTTGCMYVCVLRVGGVENIETDTLLYLCVFPVLEEEGFQCLHLCQPSSPTHRYTRRAASSSSAAAVYTYVCVCESVSLCEYISEHRGGPSMFLPCFHKAKKQGSVSFDGLPDVVPGQISLSARALLSAKLRLIDEKFTFMPDFQNHKFTHS